MIRLAICITALVYTGGSLSAQDEIQQTSYFGEKLSGVLNSCGDDCCEDICCDDPCVESCCPLDGWNLKEKLSGLFSGCGDDCVDDCCDDPCVDDGCGLFRSSDPCFNDFISPMTNIVAFEDPRTLSELRPIYLHHKVPRGVGGGNINLWAMHIRLALTERLSIIATKDGYLISSNPLIDDGFADVAAGLKYNLVRDTCEGRLVSLGAIYEIPVGSTRAAQGNGDGEFIVFISGATRIGDRMHAVAASGFRLPANSAVESKSWYLSTHFDYMMSEKAYLLMEMNWYSWFQGGNTGLPGAPTVEGGDLFNFGAPDVAGNNIVTMAFGTKYKPAENQEVGIAYEIPVSPRNDVLDNRLTIDYIFRF